MILDHLWFSVMSYEMQFVGLFLSGILEGTFYVLH